MIDGDKWLCRLIDAMAVLMRRVVSEYVVNDSVELTHGKTSLPIEVMGIGNGVAGGETARKVGGVVREASGEAIQTMEKDTNVLLARVTNQIVALAWMIRVRK